MMRKVVEVFSMAVIVTFFNYMLTPLTSRLLAVDQSAFTASIGGGISAVTVTLIHEFAHPKEKK